MSSNHTEVVRVPTMYQPPRTRFGTKTMREEFNKAVESLISYKEMENTITQFDNLTLCSNKLKQEEREAKEEQQTKVKSLDLSVGPSFYEPTSERPLLKTSQAQVLFVITPNDAT
ncbi:unnamed protein product [Arabidopsis halleri]